MICLARLRSILLRYAAGLFCVAMLAGCNTVANLVTAPVRAVGQVADWTTTSQDEADRNRGRELRKLEERYGSLQRRYADQAEDCEYGDSRDCERARVTYAEIEQIRAQLPPVPNEN